MDSEFDKFVSDAIDKIPNIYQDKLKNVTFRVEEQPTEVQRSELGLRKCDALFGLYQGVPLTKRGGAVHSIVPDVITIFKQPMMTIFAEESSLKKQVYKTVWHEVAHYFGLDHDRIHKIEKS